MIQWLCSLITNMLEPKNDKKSINFLSPEKKIDLNEDSGKTPPMSRRQFVLYFTVGLTVILALFFGIKSLMADDSLETASALKPKKIGFFQTMKNFFFASDDMISGQENNRINILLLGIGGQGHDGPYLSDTNIILSIQPNTKKVALVSIPRDLGVPIENYGVYRINYADALGEQKNPGQGGEYARQIFSQTFNLDVPYYVRVDFNAFEELINAVGGVDIDVPVAFTDYSYPGPNYSYQTINFEVGQQHMDGATALKYARSRHGTNGENSDFARSRRQQQILSAFKNKLLSFGSLANPTTLQKIWESLVQNIDTNLQFGQILYLASLAMDIDTEDIRNLVIDSSEPNGYLYSYIAQNGAFMLAPKGGNFEAINTAIANVFNLEYKPSIPNGGQYSYAYSDLSVASTAEANTSSLTIPDSVTTTDDNILIFFGDAKVEIQNGTWRAGLASKLQSQLADQGFDIITIGNSVKRPIATTTVYLINPTVPNETVNYLAEKVNGQLCVDLPEWLHEDYDNPGTMDNEMGAKFNPETDLLVILGADNQN